MGIIDKGRSCYDLILHSLSVYKELYTKNPGRDDLEDIRNHAYQLTFSAEYAMFHSQLYDWIVLHGMTDTRLERELALLAKYELLWGLHVKNDQYMLAAQTLAHLATVGGDSEKREAKGERVRRTRLRHHVKRVSRS